MIPFYGGEMDEMAKDFTSVWDILRGEVTAWVEGAVKAIPNLVTAILVMILFWVIASMSKKVLARVLPKMTRSPAVRNLTQKVVFLLILILGLFVSLGILQLDKTVTSLLAGAGVVGIALGFAFQEVASNFISGVLIAFREPYRVGDIIEVDKYHGQVTDINLRATTVRTFDGLHVIIPNKDLFTKSFINFTITEDRRMELKVGVSYGENLRKVEKVIVDALQEIPGRLKEQPVEVFFEEFGDSSINCEVHVWISYPKNKTYLRSRHEAVIRIKEAFDKNDITIPFPIRTLDFGIKGGEKMDIPLRKVFGPAESSQNGKSPEA